MLKRIVNTAGDLLMIIAMAALVAWVYSELIRGAWQLLER